MTAPAPATFADKQDEIWRELSAGISNIYEQHALSQPNFMKLYTLVYNFVANQSRPDGRAAQQGRAERDSIIKRSRISGPDGNDPSPSYASAFVRNALYLKIWGKIKDHVNDLVKKAEDKMGEQLVAFYAQEWEQFVFSSTVTNGVCSYLNRYSNMMEEHEPTYLVYDMASDIWKETFFETYQESIVGTILQLIKRERNGETINTGALKSILDSVVGFQTLDIYKQKFEDGFIRETEEFYAQEAVALFQSGITVTDYQEKVQQRMKEESRRATLYLHMSSMNRLMKCCERVLIETQLAFFHDEFPKLLKEGKIEEITRMFGFLSKLDNGFGNMRDILQAHIISEGTVTIAQNKEVCNTDPQEYINKLLNVYQKFSELIKTAFKQDPGFEGALFKAFTILVNKNVLTREPGSSHKTPQMLARYCNFLLRKSAKNYNDQELEDLLNKAMIIFSFIEDKDVFHKFYSMRLAARLIGDLSASYDAELSMITKLKLASGVDYTSKLYRMFQDIALSKNMNEDFKKWLARQVNTNLPEVDFYMMTLTTGSWPYSQDANDKAFFLPQELTPCANIFTQYYAGMHTGRKMNWLYSKSIGEVVTNCFPSKYTFVLSTFHIGVLLQYNTKYSYKLHELAEAIKLEEDVVTRIVQTFMRACILKSTDDGDNLASNSEVYLFNDYKNNKLRVNLSTPLKIDSKKEAATTQASIEKTRHLEVQAAIVRILKSRKELKEQVLISEVISQVTSRFTPAVNLIKQCIDSLVEKEYLENKGGDGNIYHYVA